MPLGRSIYRPFGGWLVASVFTTVLQGSSLLKMFAFCVSSVGRLEVMQSY